jgi:tetratricopeptide (TPR) repeat protein
MNLDKLKQSLFYDDPELALNLLPRLFYNTELNYRSLTYNTQQKYPDCKFETLVNNLSKFETDSYHNNYSKYNINSELAFFYLNYALYIYSNKDLSNEFSLQILDELLSRQPEYYYALLYKGNILNCLGKYREAIKNYNKILEEYNSYSNLTYYNKAISLFYLNELESAIDNYSLAIKYNPYPIHYYINKAYACYLNRNMEEAYNCCIVVKNSYSNLYQSSQLILDKIFYDYLNCGTSHDKLATTLHECQTESHALGESDESYQSTNTDELYQ